MNTKNFGISIFSVFSEMMAEKNIEFTHEDLVVHHNVYCDPTKMREVFMNLLSNAYKYTKPGGKVHVRLRELPSNREGYAFLETSVSDTGIGMSAEFLAHIFEEFSRENTTTANKIEGTGLGMPIVKRLVELMGGTIRVTSEKGVGTTFVVTLPHRIANESENAEPETIVADETVFDGKRILLAEDNDLNAEIAEEILTSAGFMIERAEDGAICYEKIVSSDKGYYDLVLMDIQMPNMDGYQATRAIRALADKEKANIPIIAMTANAFEEDRSKAVNVGMNGHIAKPIDVTELLRELAKVLAHK